MATGTSGSQPPPARRLTPFDKRARAGVVEALATDAAVRAAAAGEAVRSGRSIDSVLAEARGYAGEIVPQFSARLHHRVAYLMARRLAMLLFRVRVGYMDEEALARIPGDASPVFVINHRSNMDYVLVAFLAAEQVAISFAVGEWARVWPLDTLSRSLGAYFVRRRSGNAVYRKVLERYVQTAVAQGVTQAVFLEGGLSRDGRLHPPKFGLLSYITRAALHADGNQQPAAGMRDVVFVPVAVNYDRVLEDRTLLRDLEPDRPRMSRWRTASEGAAWIAKNVMLYARGRWYRFGYACVNFGAPVSLGDVMNAPAEEGTATTDERARTERLATLLMDEIAALVPVTPVSLVATALLSFEGDAATHPALVDRAAAFSEELASTGARLYAYRRDAADIVAVGLRMLALRRIVTIDGESIRIANGERQVVEFYANSIAHLLPSREAGTESPRPAAPGPPLPSTRESVILVHGLARTSRSMARLARALTREGYEVRNWDYPSRRFGVMALVDALEEFARAESARSPRVHFVTHSMGGILARGVLGRNQLPHVGRLVMIAPPNQGSQIASRLSEHEWAKQFYGPAIGDLSTDPARGVAMQLRIPQCEFGVIAGTRGFHPLQPSSYLPSRVRPPGPHDGTIHVDETRLEGMADFVTVNANHMFIMDDEETIRQTLRFLAHGRFNQR